jgi:DNA repair ATPase RecN
MRLQQMALWPVHQIVAGQIHQTEERRSELLITLQTAKEKLQVLQNINHHSQEVRNYFDDSIAWLDRGVSYFSEMPRNIEEIEQMVSPVRQLLSQAAKLVEKEKKLPDDLPAIDPILKKTERILEKFRESFIALAQGGIELDQEALASYVKAFGMYQNVKEVCMKDRTQCTQLNIILEHLAKVRAKFVN